MKTISGAVLFVIGMIAAFWMNDIGSFDPTMLGYILMVVGAGLAVWGVLNHHNASKHNVVTGGKMHGF